MIKGTFLFLLLFPAILFAQVDVQLGMGEMDLQGAPDVYAHYTPLQVSFHEVENSKFISCYNQDFPVELQKALWIKFRLHNTDVVDRKFYLRSFTDEYQVFSRSDTGWERQVNGQGVPLNDRADKHTFLFVPIYLEANETRQIYVRMITGGALHSEGLKLVDETVYQSQLNKVTRVNKIPFTVSVIYLSGIFILFLFVLIIYINVSKKVFLFYLLFLLCQILQSLLIFEPAPVKPIKFALNFPVFTDGLAEGVLFAGFGFYVFFIMELLSIKKGKLSTTLRGFAGLLFTYAVVITVVGIAQGSPFSLEGVYQVMRAFLLPMDFLLVLWIIIRIRHPLIPFFIIAHVFFFLGGGLSFLANVFLWNKYGFWGDSGVIFRLGMLGEAIFFSLALAYWIRLILKGREASVKAYINQLRENERIQQKMNAALDQKVALKTRELSEAYSEMELQKERELKLEFERRLNEVKNVALRSQMNPHFLFNSMNALKSMIISNRLEEATRYLDGFSILMRSILQNSQREIITVEDELEILRLYLYMEKERMGDEFQYQITAEDEPALSLFPIPAMLLQPFVENAIWHGLSQSDKKKKLLSVCFDVIEEEELEISIKDNGIGRKASAYMKRNGGIHESLGTKITEERIALFNYSHELKIKLKITDLYEGEVSSGTLVILTFSY